MTLLQAHKTLDAARIRWNQGGRRKYNGQMDYPGYLERAMRAFDDAKDKAQSDTTGAELAEWLAATGCDPTAEAWDFLA